MAESGIPLAKVVHALRGELIKAMKEGEGQPLRFDLESVEVELYVSVEEGATAEAGVDFKVLKLGIGDSATETRGQKVTLRMTPRDPTRPGVTVPLGAKKP